MGMGALATRDPERRNGKNAQAPAGVRSLLELVLRVVTASAKKMIPPPPSEKIHHTARRASEKSC